jgi:hypothetical protein
MFTKLDEIKRDLKVYNFSKNANSMIDFCIEKKLERLEKESGSLPVISKKKDLNLLQNRFLVHVVNERKSRNKSIEFSDFIRDKDKLGNTVRVKPLLSSSDERYLQNCLNNLTIGCFNKFDKNYSLSERNKFRARAIQKYKENREFANQQINYYQRLPELKDVYRINFKKHQVLDKILDSRDRELKKKPKNLNQNVRKNDVILGVEFSKKKLCLSRSLDRKIELEKLGSAFKIVKEREEVPETVRKILSKISHTIDEHKIPLNRIKQDSVERILSGKKKQPLANFFNNDPDMIVYEETFRNYYKN